MGSKACRGALLVISTIVELKFDQTSNVTQFGDDILPSTIREPGLREGDRLQSGLMAVDDASKGITRKQHPRTTDFLVMAYVKSFQLRQFLRVLRHKRISNLRSNLGI